MGKEESRVVDVDITDMTNLLSSEQPKFDSLSEGFINRLKQQDVGSLILKFVPSEEDDIEISFLVSAWRGQRACRLYLSRHERIHHLNLINKPIPEYLQLNKNTYNKKNDNRNNDKKNDDKIAQGDKIDGKKIDAVVEKVAGKMSKKMVELENKTEVEPVSKKAKLSADSAETEKPAKC